jgi:hypothetical protein
VSSAGYLIAHQVDNGLMPVWTASEAECDNPWSFKHDPRLARSDIDMLVEWDALGAPLGDPEDAAPVPTPLTFDLPDVTAELPMAAFTTDDSAGDDQFVCFSVDPGNTTTQWLEGIQLIPGNDRIDHHAVVTLDVDGVTADTPTYPCFGGDGLSNHRFLGAWVPGARPIEYPDGTGIEVPAGARIVVQMHYHPLATPETDSSRLDVRMRETAPLQTATMALIGNYRTQDEEGFGVQPGACDGDEPDFYIPASTVEDGRTDCDPSSHTEVLTYKVPGGANTNLEVFMLANHMHYIGRSMRVSVERTSGQESDVCLLDTPEWDFDWQQVFEFERGDAPVLHGGDTLVIECTYDNTLDNPGVVRALEESGETTPPPVTIGNGSLDEMCLVAVGVAPTD